MRCLEKDRSRRYETVNGLATDIARQLNNEPIVARPPSRLYRFQKTVQRNKLTFGVGLVIAIAAALGLVLLSISNIRIDAARRAERAERQKAEAANQQLLETLHLLDHTRGKDWPEAAVDLRAVAGAGARQRGGSNQLAQALMSRNAIQFNRITAIVEVPHARPLNAMPMTFTAWIKTEHSALPGAVGVVKKIVYKTCDGYAVFLLGGHLRAWYWKDCSNKIYNGTYEPTGVFDGGFVADGQWHHVAFIVDTLRGTLCVDGKATTTLAWTGTAGAPTNTAPLQFGHHEGEFSLGGLMAEATLWNRALSEAELQEVMQARLTGKEPDLVGYWPFDEASGNFAHDRSGHGHDGKLEIANDRIGHGHDGTLVSGPEWVRPVVPGAR